MTNNETKILRGRGQGSPLYEAMCKCSDAIECNRRDADREALMDLYDDLDEQDQALVLELHRMVLRDTQAAKVARKVARIKTYLESLIDYGTKH